LNFDTLRDYCDYSINIQGQKWLLSLNLFLLESNFLEKWYLYNYFFTTFETTISLILACVFILSLFLLSLFFYPTIMKIKWLSQKLFKICCKNIGHQFPKHVTRLIWDHDQEIPPTQGRDNNSLATSRK